MQGWSLGLKRLGLEGFFERLGLVSSLQRLGILCLIYVELQTYNSNFKILYSLYFGRLNITVDNTDFCLFLNCLTLVL